MFTMVQNVWIIGSSQMSDKTYFQLINALVFVEYQILTEGSVRLRMQSSASC